MRDEMGRLLAAKEGLDLSSYPKDGDCWSLPKDLDVEGKELFDRSAQCWIWSVGRLPDGRVLAAPDSRFYGDPSVECLWLR